MLIHTSCMTSDFLYLTLVQFHANGEIKKVGYVCYVHFHKNNGHNLVFGEVRAHNHICEANETPVVVYRVETLFRDYYSVLIT